MPQCYVIRTFSLLLCTRDIGMHRKRNPSVLHGVLIASMPCLPITRSAIHSTSLHQVVYRRPDSNNYIISTPITEDLRCLQDFKQQDALKRMHDRHGERKHRISSCGEMSKGGLLTCLLGQGLTCYCNVLQNVTTDLGSGRKR